MTVYGGFAPGTYQAWALNLLPSVFMSAGVARAMSVTANSPAGMTVLVTVDPTFGDGICYLPNGAFLRIDAQTTLSVPANGTGSTRTDAVVAQVDPTGNTNPSLSYVTNWSQGFNGASNQFVLAQVSVASGASSITSGNITLNTARANFNSGGSATNLNNALYAANNTAQGGVFVTPTQITGTLEGYTIQVWNGSQLVNLIGVGTNSSSPLSYFDQNATYWGTASTATSASYSTILMNQATTTGQRWFISGTTPTNATVGDVWIMTNTTLA